MVDTYIIGRLEGCPITRLMKIKKSIIDANETGNVKTILFENY